MSPASSPSPTRSVAHAGGGGGVGASVASTLTTASCMESDDGTCDLRRRPDGPMNDWGARTAASIVFFGVSEGVVLRVFLNRSCTFGRAVKGAESDPREL